MPFTDVKLTDSFWAGRQTTNRQVTVAHNFSEMEKQGSLGGFRILSGDSSEKYHGYMWGDSDVYKAIEGAQYLLRTQPDPELEKKLETLISQIARSQAPSGFLFPHLQITEPKYPLFERETSGTCESYSMGHLMESAVEHFKTTGRTNYLEVARRAADLMVQVNQEGKALQVSGHPEVEIGLVKLFKATGEQAYLDLAQRLVEGYKTHLSMWSHGKPAMADDDVIGHAVAVMYLYAGACDVGAIKGDPALIDLLERKWERVVGRKMYVTGGVGHRQHSEGFSDDYVLPDEEFAYCETCSAIANVLWSGRMFRLQGESKYYDVIERVLYNALAAGSGLSGDRFFYANPLAADRRKKPVKRWSWHQCPCCPANLVRFWPRLSEYVFAVGSSDLYVNLFAACEGSASVAGTTVRLRVKTDYPWDGRVALEVTPEKPQPFALRIRIPGWAEGKPLPSDLYRYTDPAGGKVALQVNGVDFAAPREKGYAVIQRTWKAGDRVEFALPMPIRHVVAHEKVAAANGKVAVERGPLVYCAEGIDNADKVTDLVLADSAATTLESRPALVNGIRIIKADALRVDTRQQTSAKDTMTLIPYYAWNYRGAGGMRVWLARTPEAVQPEPHDTSAWIGANYTPAYAANQIQMWHEFKPEVIERELTAAVKYFGINTLRVYLHNIVYDTEKQVFLERIEAFLEICDRHGIKPGFVFFDDCWNHAGITIDTPPPVDGRHNGRWAALQDAERKDENLPKFKAYVQAVIAAHRDDQRVLWWEIYNEPNMGDAFTLKLREAGYGWAKEMKPTQPVIACWDDHPWTDIVDAHNYSVDWAAWDRQANMNPTKGTVFTEAGARWFGKKPSSAGSPIEVINWLKTRKAGNKSVPGVYLCWELMVGNSNCRWYWGTPDGAPEPAIPWCGLLWPDCTPVSHAEAEAVRSYATGKKQALLFEDFQSVPPPQVDPVPGWTAYGESAEPGGSRYLKLSGQSKMVAGENAWGDYLLEATVMLKDGIGNAGICFRVNDPGPGTDQMRGYYLGIDTHSLYLGKMEIGWKQMAAVALADRPNKVETDTWNLLRVVVEGNRIRAWLNPLHDDTRPLLDVRDEDNPILKGAVGLRVSDRAAWFDDVVVLPEGAQ
ncbi:MAG: glycoside hydrolase family 127 protein [Akkermansiaceae bacterium]|nr:glycoside hydrolase family 127 protein [Akkermansiaceae bacterium]